MLVILAHGTKLVFTMFIMYYGFHGVFDNDMMVSLDFVHEEEDVSYCANTALYSAVVTCPFSLHHPLSQSSLTSRGNQRVWIPYVHIL